MRFLCAAFACLFPMAALANDTGLKRLTLRQDVLGWEAVGRLDFPSGYCSGALIAPDLVLTAAHCLVDRRTGARRDPGQMTFRAALTDGNAIAQRTGKRAVMHPQYNPANGDNLLRIQTDIALVQLDKAIPAATASPYVTDRAPAPGQRVSLVSYAQERDKAPSWQQACALLVRQQGVMNVTCDANFGASGAPIFANVNGRPRIVGVVSSGKRTSEGSSVWGPLTADALGPVKSALRAGRGVWEAGASPTRPKTNATASNRLSQGTRARANSAAKFLRP